MTVEEAPGIESIRHVLERTTKDPEVLRDLIEQDPAFAALCRDYRRNEIEIHQLRRRCEQLESDLLARIEASGRSGSSVTSDVERSAQDGLRDVQDDLRRMLAVLIKAGLAQTDEAATTRWRTEAVNLHEELRSRLATVTDEEAHLDVLWNQALQEAQSDPLVRAEENMKPILPVKCLFTLLELTAPDFNVATAAARIRISTTTG